MGRKIFVSYKYADSQVLDLGITEFFARVPTTARHYVDALSSILETEDHIFKGEDDGEDMSLLKDSTIASKLGDKIFDSSITIVLISKGMKTAIPEKDQWIPWEISYSLKEQSRFGGNSKTNALLAIVLPDESGKYNYFIEDNICSYCNCRTVKTNSLFQILRDNMFNIKNPHIVNCRDHTSYIGYCSFIESVKWNDFIINPNQYIDIAISIRAKMNEYNIVKNIK